MLKTISNACVGEKLLLNLQEGMEKRVEKRVESTNLPVLSKSKALMLSVCPFSFEVFDPDLGSQTRTT